MAKKKTTVGDVYRAFLALSLSDRQAFVDVLPPIMLSKNPSIAMLLDVAYPNLDKQLEAARKKRSRNGKQPFPGEDEAYAGIAQMMGWSVAETEKKLKRPRHKKTKR